MFTKQCRQAERAEAHSGPLQKLAARLEKVIGFWGVFCDVFVGGAHSRTITLRTRPASHWFRAAALHSSQALRFRRLPTPKVGSLGGCPRPDSTMESVLEKFQLS